MDKTSSIPSNVKPAERSTGGKSTDGKVRSDDKSKQQNQYNKQKHGYPRREIKVKRHYTQDDDQLNEALKRIQNSTDNLNTKLNFVFDEKTQQVVVEVLEGTTGKVVRRLSPIELLELAETMSKHKGALIDRKG